MTRKRGRCLCGAVSFEADMADRRTRGCHCADCRRWSGSAVFVVGPIDGVTIAGADALVWFASSDWAERGFCGRCGSNLFWRAKGRTDMSVMIGALDDTSDLEVVSEIFSDERAHFFEPVAGARQETRADVIDRYTPRYDGDWTQHEGRGENDG